MFESVVATVLNQVLGNFISNLEQNQLNLGLFSGNVVLTGLRVRKEALDKLNLPLEVFEGYLGHLELVIPWTNLKNQPVKVLIRDLFILAGPRGDDNKDTPNDEAALKASLLKQAEVEFKAKMERLQTAELFQTTSKGDNSAKDNSGFVGQLVTKIIDNLQVTIENIYIRYEDFSSHGSSGRGFSLGIGLERLSAVSTNSSWEPTFLTEPGITIHKFAKLDRLAIFCNPNSRESYHGLDPDCFLSKCREDVLEGKCMKQCGEAVEENANNHIRGLTYLLQPVSGIGKIILNKKYIPGQPKTLINLEFDQLSLVLDDEQYFDILTLLTVVTLDSRKAAYRHLRPTVNLYKDPLAWFRFAVNCQVEILRKRNKIRTWEHVMERRQNRLKYVELFKQKLLSVVPNIDKKRFPVLNASEEAEIDALERKLSYEDLYLYRSIARTDAKRLTPPVVKSKGGWLSGWWGSNTAAATEDSSAASVALPQASTIGDLIDESDVKALYDTIDFSEGAAPGSPTALPADTEELGINLQLFKGSITLVSASGPTRNVVLAAEMGGLLGRILKRPTTVRAEFKMNHLELLERFVEGSLFPKLVASKNSNSFSMVDDGPFFSLAYDQLSSNPDADSFVQLKMKPLIVVLNHLAAQHMIDFALPKRCLTLLDSLKSAATPHLAQLQTRTRSGMQHALEQHKAIDVNVEMAAPLLLIPSDCTDPNGFMLAIDLGRIHVGSQLVSAFQKEEFSLKKQVLSVKEMQRLVNLMYDILMVDLCSTRIAYCPKIEEWICNVGIGCAYNEDSIVPPKYSNNWELMPIEWRLLDKVDMEISVGISILGDSIGGGAEMPKIKVSGRVPTIAINFSDSKYQGIMTLVDLFLGKSKYDDVDDPVNSLRDTSILQTKSVVPSKSLSESSDEFFDAVEDTANPVTAMEAKSYEQVDVYLDFVLDELSVGIYKSSQAAADKILGRIVADRLEFRLIKRSLDMDVKVLLDSFSIEDHVRRTAEGLLTSCYLMDGRGNTEFMDAIEDGLSTSHDSNNNAIVQSVQRQTVPSSPTSSTSSLNPGLLAVSLKMINREHPERSLRYNDASIILKVDISSVRAYIDPATIGAYLQFIMSTFSSEAKTQAVEEVNQKTLAALPPTSAADADLINVNVHLSQLLVSIGQTGQPDYIGEVDLRSAVVSLGLMGEKMTVLGKLASMDIRQRPDAFFDEAKFHQHLQQVPILTVEGEEVVEFVYETFPRVLGKDSAWPGYDTFVKLVSGSLAVGFSPVFINNILNFAMRLQSAMPKNDTIYDDKSVGKVPSDSKQPPTDLQKIFHFDIDISSPILRIYRPSDPSTVLAIYPGRFTLKNDNKPFGDDLSTSSIIDQIINLTVSKMHITLASNFNSLAHETQVFSILEEATMAIQVMQAGNFKERDFAATEIEGKLDRLAFRLNDKLYEVLMTLINEVTSCMPFMLEPLNKQPPDPAPKSHNLTRTTSKISMTTKKDDKPIKETTLDLSFILGSIQIDLLTTPKESSICNESIPLANFCLQGGSLSLQSINDGSMVMELGLEQINLKDTRPTMGSNLRPHRQIIRSSKTANDKNVSLMVRFQRSMEDSERSEDVLKVTLDQIQVLLVMDYILELNNFVQSGFSSKNPATESSSESQTAQSKTSVSANASKMIIFASAFDTKIRLVADSQDENSEAVQLLLPQLDLSMDRETGVTKNLDSAKVSQPVDQNENYAAEMARLSIESNDPLPTVPLAADGASSIHESFAVGSYTDTNLTLTLANLAMSFCRMTPNSKNQLVFVDPFEISISAHLVDPEIGELEEVGQTDVHIILGRLQTRISLQDLQIFQAIAAQMNPTTDQDAKTAEMLEEVQSPRLSIDGTAPASPAQASPEPPKNKRRLESLHLDCASINLVIVDDFDSVHTPVLDGSIDCITLQLRDWSSGSMATEVIYQCKAESPKSEKSVQSPIEYMKASAIMKLSANYFNPICMAWEPLLESLPLNFSLIQSQLASNPLLIDIAIGSRQSADLVLTHAFIDLMMKFSSKLSRIASDKSAAKRTHSEPIPPYLLDNQSGCCIELIVEESHFYGDGRLSVGSAGSGHSIRKTSSESSTLSSASLAERVNSSVKLKINECCPWAFITQTQSSNVWERRISRLGSLGLSGGRQAGLILKFLEFPASSIAPPPVSLKGLSFDREGYYVFSYFTDSGPDAFVVQVEKANTDHLDGLADGVKRISFRSCVAIKNLTDISISMLPVASLSASSFNVEPGQANSVPLGTGDRLQIGIDNGSTWSVSEFSASELLKLANTEHSSKRNIFGKKKSDQSIAGMLIELRTTPLSKYLIAYAIPDRPIFGSLEAVKQLPMTIKIRAPLTFFNELPYRISSLWMSDLDEKTEWQLGSVEAGGKINIYEANTQHRLVLSVIVDDGICGLQSVAPVLVNSHDPDEQSSSMIVTSSSQTIDQVSLGLEYRVGAGTSRRVILYAPYLIVNQTGLPIGIQANSLFKSSQDAVLKKASGPILFSYGDAQGGGVAITKKRSRIAVGDDAGDTSEWSKAISLDAVGTVIPLHLHNSNSTKWWNVSITVQMSTCMSRSKVVTIAPMYVFVDLMPPIDGWQACMVGTLTMIRESRKIASIPRNSGDKGSFPLYVDPDRLASDMVLVFQKTDDPSQKVWTAPFSMEQPGKVFLPHPVLCSQDKIPPLIRIDQVIQDHSISQFVRATLTETWPFYLKNRTSYTLECWQQSSEEEGGSGSYRRNSTNGTLLILLEPGQGVPFTWDRPGDASRRLAVTVSGDGNRISSASLLNIDEIGQIDPKALKSINDRVIDVNVRARGPVLRVEFKERILRSTSLGNIFRKNSNEEVNTEPQDPVQTRITFNLPGLGIAVVNQQLEELLYLFARDLELRYSQSRSLITYGLEIGSLQIDNQLIDWDHPILFYPATTSKKTERSSVSSAPQSFISLAVIKSVSSAYGVEYFKYLGFLMQEAALEVGEDILLKLADFAKFDNPATSNAFSASAMEEEVKQLHSHLPIMEAFDEDSELMYFELFQIHPVKISFSFSRTEGLYNDPSTNSSEEKPSTSYNPLTAIVTVLTMAIGNISDAPLKFNSLLLEHPIIRRSVLSRLVTTHYIQQGVNQVHRVLGSADFFGNPVGLFSSFGSGVTDLFYEPYLGFVSDRPQDIGIGFAKGGLSLVRKTVSGLTGTFSKITGSLGKGLSAATFDPAFQQQRRRSQARNKPKHAVGGVTTGTTQLLSGLTSGITGLVEKPMEGAKEAGIGGFFRGVGVGLMGVVTKPIVGVIDLTTSLTEGIKSTADEADESAELAQIRLPRAIPWDGILRPYNARDAQGQSLLSNLQIYERFQHQKKEGGEGEEGDYSDERYVSFAQLPDDQTILLLTTARFILLDQANQGCPLWAYNLNQLIHVTPRLDCVVVRVQPTGDSGEGEVRQRVLSCPDPTSQKWIVGQFEEAMAIYNQQHQ